MHLKELSLTGFKAYPSSLRIQFSPHLTTITGSNGSGKSSIISAILFALNGTDSPSELVNNTCKSASVTLKFSNKTSVTRIYDKNTKVNKFKINDSTVTTQTYMKHLAELNLSETSFYSIQQGAVTKLVSMTKQQLCDFVKQMAGVKFYEERACKAMIKLEEKEKSLLLNKKKINETISPFFYKLKQFRENHLNLQKKKEIQNKIQELKKINYKKELKEIKEKIKLKIKLIKEEKKIETENKFDLLKRKEEINQLIYKLNLEEMKEEFLKNKEEISKLTKIPDNYLKLQEKYNTLFSKEMNKYSEKTDNLIELLTNVKLSLENYSEKNTNNFDKNFINLLKELICKIEKNNFDLQEIEIKKIKEEENFIKNFEKIYRRKNEIKELIFQLKSNLNYPILEGVFGKVSENFTLKEEKYSVAIQSILGNKGSFVIVENEKIGSNLLNLDQPITVIPLNKIVTYPNKLTNHLCLIDCINFDSKVSNAMKYIFNNIYLADNKEMANEICYKNKCMAVLLDGTVYDPKGTMTVGGNFDQSKINFVENFLNLEDISFLEKYNFDNSEKILKSLENILKYKINSSVKGIFLLEKLLNFLEKNTFYLTNFNLINKLIDLIKEVKLLQEYENIKKLKNNVNEFKKLKKELEEEILVEHKKYVKNERVKKELNELENKLVKLEEKIKLAEVKKEELEIELEKLEEKINFCDEISKQEECRKEVIKSNFELKKEINQLIYKFNEIYEEAHEFIDNLEEKVKKSNEEIKDFCEKLKIPPEKSKILLSRMSKNFNYPNVENLSEKLNDLLKEYEKVKDIKKYKIDPKNFDLLEKNEKILEELEKKISLLEIDKIKISSTLEKLNEASSKAEKKALIHLNTNLTKYIQYFLPNLEISINDSYNLKILQNKTEVSLNALSGGQRSLIALCYLFTALSYNPSIFYIFDEIDAALDVKYCSQIGEMLKKEIKAQFVVVSLRDEMAKQGDLMLKVVLEENRPVVKQVSK